MVGPLNVIPFVFSTTLLLYKLDTLLLKQKQLDITGFFFRIRTQVTPWCYAPRPSTEYSCVKRKVRTSTFTRVRMRNKIRIRLFIIPINGPTIGANKLHTLIIVIGGNYTYIYKKYI